MILTLLTTFLFIKFQTTLWVSFFDVFWYLHDLTDIPTCTHLIKLTCCIAAMLLGVGTAKLLHQSMKRQPQLFCLILQGFP